jgi:hypothetical protein
VNLNKSKRISLNGPDIIEKLAAEIQRLAAVVESITVTSER